MKFKTKKTSETGKKLADMEKRWGECFEAQKALSKEVGFVAWRPGHWCVASGISSMIFPDGFEIPNHFKVVSKNAHIREHMPKLTTTKGKELQAKIEALPTIGNNELNECVGFSGSIFKSIGFNLADEYYLFSLNEDWKYEAPEDCTEITNKEYNELTSEKETT